MSRPWATTEIEAVRAMRAIGCATQDIVAATGRTRAAIDKICATYDLRLGERGEARPHAVCRYLRDRGFGRGTPCTATVHRVGSAWCASHAHEMAGLNNA